MKTMGGRKEKEREKGRTLASREESAAPLTESALATRAMAATVPREKGRGSPAADAVRRSAEPSCLSMGPRAWVGARELADLGSVTPVGPRTPLANIELDWQRSAAAIRLGRGCPAPLAVGMGCKKFREYELIA